MERLYTNVIIPKSPFSIAPGESILSIGSCFAKEIGSYFNTHLFSTRINPYGTIYNPASITTNLIRSIEQQHYQQKDLFHNKNYYYSLSHNTEFQNTDPTKLLDKLHKIELLVQKALHQASTLIITLGTAWYYQLKESQKIVANCHKLPAHLFERKLLSPDEIQRYLHKLLTVIKEKLPHLNIIFTVSPIRHLRDNAVENSQSKGALIYSLRDIVTQFEKSYYFPSFEIMMDELRDYRFYKDDLITPSSKAVAYIWEQLQKAVLTKESQNFIQEYQPILKSKRHRFSSSEGIPAFVNKMTAKLKQLEKSYPTVTFENDYEYFLNL